MSAADSAFPQSLADRNLLRHVPTQDVARRYFKRKPTMFKIYFISGLLISSITACGQSNNNDKNSDLAFYQATSKWFSAWELVSQVIYKIETVRPVEFVFFDDTYVYSTSAVTIKNGISVVGNNLMNLKFQWRKELHNDTLTLPDHSVIPVNLLSFAAEIPAENKSFFVMPLPGFWQQAGVSGKELGLENLITGVFIHEFSHSQQMQNFGRKMTEFEKQTNYGIEFSDDIVQHIFEKDTTYLRMYKKEIDIFYGSAKNNVFDSNAVKAGLSLMKQRQHKYFRGEYEKLNEIDDFFLTMEGLGQYSMFLWLTNPKGGNVKRETAIEGVRRGGKWWSQDEGFALFLILDKLTKPANWARDMFGNKTESVTNLINRYILSTNE